MARQGSRDRGLFERPKGSGIWWIRYHDGDGREHREKIGTKGLARRVYEKRKTELREDRYFPPDRTRRVLVREIVESYRKWSEESGKVITDCRPAWDRVIQRFGDISAETLKPTDIEEWALELSKQFSASSVNHHLALLSASYNRAQRHGSVSVNPMHLVPRLKANNIRVRCLSEAEESRLLEALPEWLRPLVVVALHTGMRRGELLRLRWSDVDFATSTIVVREAKSGEGRRLPMSVETRQALRALWEKGHKVVALRDCGAIDLAGHAFAAPNGGFMHSLDRYWYPALRRAAIPDFHFHDLRHTFASRLAMKGVDLYRVQTLMGHKTPEMTQRYAHLSPDTLREAVERLDAEPAAARR